MQNAGFLFAAFSLVWVVLFGFIIALLAKQSKLKREVELLKEAYKEKDNS